jgi:hypothetical protein
MLKMVDGTGNIGVDMICPLGISTPQPPNYDRVELEGAGMLVLPNSLDAPLERLELGGKTAQVTTTGAQLFEAKNAELNKWVDSTGIIATVGRNCIFRLNVKPNTVYQVNILSASCTFSFSQFSKENVFLERTVFSKGTKSFKCTTTENVDYAYFLIGGTVDNINGIINDVMLYEGEEYKNYEPYTGGKPSPSQEYQQEIKNVGKWNEKTQKYEVDVKITNAEQNWSKEQTITLTSDRPLTKWDRLVEQGGEIGWLYAGVAIDRFDGQSNKISIANKQGNVQNFSIRFENVANGNGNSDIFVDKYRAVQLSYTKAEYGICCNWNNGVKFFSAPNEKVTNLEEFKAWLIENPLGLAYETLETEFIPLPQSEQNAIRALKTYYPTTVITADGGELDPDIKVTYRKEI